MLLCIHIAFLTCISPNGLLNDCISTAYCLLDEYFIGVCMHD